MRWEVVAEPVEVHCGQYVQLNCTVVSMPFDGSVPVSLVVGTIMQVVSIDYYPEGFPLYTVDCMVYARGEMRRVRFTINAECFDVLGDTPF